MGHISIGKRVRRYLQNLMRGRKQNLIGKRVREHLGRLMSFAPGDEFRVRQYSARDLAANGFEVTMQQDVKNVLARRGAPSLCLNAHLDSLVVGIGADDRCGIAAILAAVAEDKSAPVAVLLTVGEESGGYGGHAVPADWWDGIGLCASFDRHGATDIITHYAGKQLASDAILERVARAAHRCGMRVNLTPSASMADAHTFAARVPCANVACGFYDEHTWHEYYRADDVEQAAHVAARLMTEEW